MRTNVNCVDVADCKTCANQYHCADGVSRCRIANSRFGIECTAEAADGCNKFEPSSQPWFDGGWCVDQVSVG